MSFDYQQKTLPTTYYMHTKKKASQRLILSENIPTTNRRRLRRTGWKLAGRSACLWRTSGWWRSSSKAWRSRRRRRAPSRRTCFPPRVWRTPSRWFCCSRSRWRRRRACRSSFLREQMAGLVFVTKTSVYKLVGNQRCFIYF